MLKHFSLLMLLVLLAIPAFAQDDTPEVVVDGLINPRHLSFDSAGNMYVAEAGSAGDLLTDSDTEFGATSRITRVTPDGEVSVEVLGLISYRAGDSLGASDVLVTDDSIWVLLGENNDFRIPFTQALVELDKETKRVKTFIDLLTPELELDPDGNPNQQSNPVDFAVAPDGTIYVAAAGCNCLMSWTAEDGVQIAAAWPFDTDNPVPTSVDIDANGDLYVGFLTGFPFPDGGSRIEKWSGGELVETYEGLTTVTDVLVTEDGTIYAVELGSNGMQGPGRIVTVNADGVTPVLEGLMAPYGIAQDADGVIYATIGAIGGENGAVIIVPGM